MDFRTYQENAKRTMGSELDQQGLIIMGCMGLAGEAGEVVDHFKKALFHENKPLDADAVVLELGDVLWYVACLCTALGIDMGAVAQENERKLRARYPERFGVDRCPTCNGASVRTLPLAGTGAATAVHICLMGHEWEAAS